MHDVINADLVLSSTLVIVISTTDGIEQKRHYLMTALKRNVSEETSVK